MTRVLLSLDLSTTCTGWCKLDLDTKELLSYGIKTPAFKNPKTKGIQKYVYPQLQVMKLNELADQVIELIDDSVEVIVIEEINRGKNRLGQKVLDGFHFILLSKMTLEVLSRVIYIDSDGNSGWRSANGLKLQLSSFNKETNKDRKKLNNKMKKGSKKLPLITQKTLACNYVNKIFNLTLDSDLDAFDGDIADALGLGWFTITKVI